MKKIMMISLLFTLLFSGLLGCDQKTNDIVKANNSIIKVSISKSTGFGKINLSFVKVLEDDASLDIFQRVLSEAVREEGIVDMAEPEWDLEIAYKKGDPSGYHLWVGEKGQRSALMRIEDTNTVYSIPEELTEELNNFFP